MTITVVANSQVVMKDIMPQRTVESQNTSTDAVHASKENSSINLENKGMDCEVAGGQITTEAARVSRVVVANRASSSISVIDPDHNQPIGTYAMPDEGEPMYVVYDAPNNAVLVGDYTGQIVAFDAKDFSVIGTAPAGEGVFHMWLSPDYSQLWVNNELDKTISVIDPTTLTTLATINIPGELAEDGFKPHDVVISPDNASAYVSLLKGGVDINYIVEYDTQTFSEVDRVAVGPDPHVSVTSENNFLYVASQGSDELAIIDRNNLDVTAVINIPNAHGLGMSPDGDFLYIGNIADGGTNATYTLDVSTNTLVGDPVDAPFPAPHNYAVTYNNSKLFVTHSGGMSNQVSIYDLTPEPALLNTITVENNPFGLVAYSFIDSELTICAGDGQSDAFDVSLSGAVGDNTAWVITDANGTILGLPATPPFDLEGAGAGTCLVWHLSYADGLQGLAAGQNALELEGCHDLSNPITVNRNTAEGGELSLAGGGTELTICAGDGQSDAFDVSLSGAVGDNTAWVITDANGIILGLPTAPPFDLEGAGAGTCLVWHLSYADGLQGLAAGQNALELEGCHDLSNPITVNRNTAEGGELSLAGGGTELTICAGDGQSDAFDVSLSGAVGDNTAWVVTDANGAILGLPAAPPFDLEGAGAGTCLVWHLSYADGLQGLAAGQNALELEGCHDLSNPITVNRLTGSACSEDCMPDGATVMTSGGMTTVERCVGDVLIPVTNTSAATDLNYWYIITDASDHILAYVDPSTQDNSDEVTLDLSGAPTGICHIWGWSFTDQPLPTIGHHITTLDDDDCADISDNWIRVIRYEPLGGDLTLADGSTDITICTDDGQSDLLQATVTGAKGIQSVFLITDANGQVLAQSMTALIDLEGAGSGLCQIWHLSYIPGLFDLDLATNVYQLSGCYGLSNPININRLTGTACQNTVTLQRAAANDVALYPNPAQQTVQVRYEQVGDGLITDLGILDMNGRSVQSHRLPEGSSQIRLDISQLAAGTYYVQWKNQQQLIIKPLVVIE